MARWTFTVVTAGAALAMSVSLAVAQPRPAVNMQIQDQPGYVPTPEEEELPAEYHRQVVFYRTTEPPGTIVVDTPARFLYLVQGNSRAIRYGIGVGRDGFQWSG
jgi:lipoprotein-anchoring transpeptidase ErfK/SrfK